MVNEQQIWEILNHITDPEIPVISIVDLGIVDQVKVQNNLCNITIIPTYTSCPAMQFIKNQISTSISNQCEVKVDIVLSPVWTTDRITEKGKKMLKEFGIAPPNNEQYGEVQCPKCNSLNTSLVSFFGSTSCKSLYKCTDCLEPFDYFKCHK